MNIRKIILSIYFIEAAYFSVLHTNESTSDKNINWFKSKIYIEENNSQNYFETARISKLAKLSPAQILNISKNYKEYNDRRIKVARPSAPSSLSVKLIPSR